MEITRRRFILLVLGTTLGTAAFVGGLLRRLTPRVVTVARRAARFPGRIIPISYSRIRRRAHWAG